MTVPSQDHPPVSRPGDPRPPVTRPLEAVQAAVAQALSGLDELAGRPAAEHLPAFERVHAALGAALAAGAPGRA